MYGITNFAFVSIHVNPLLFSTYTFYKLFDFVILFQIITMAKNAGMDEYALKYIVGHAIQDVTERVYTQREISWLIDEMQKIK